MHKLIVGIVMLVLSGLAIAAASVPLPKSKATTSMPAKPQARAKPKPVAPKYYYVKATPLVVLPAATATAVMVPEVQTTVPEVGEVQTGRMVCEMGNSVTVTPDPQQPARFIVQMKKHTFHMTPVETSTGAVRLEDVQAGAMWLQLPNKSMLMNSHLGQRMADECQSDHQTAVAHRMKLDPPPSLLGYSAIAKK